MKVRLLLCMSALLLAACSAIPQKQLTDYRDAFSAAQTQLQDVLLDHENVRAEFNSADTTATKSPASSELDRLGVSSSFRTKGDGTASTRDPHIEERLAALRVVSKYNDMLNTLAEGKSVAAATSSAGALATSLQAIAGVVPGVNEILPKVIDQLEKARLREEFKKAVSNGAPIIVKIINVFRSDLEDYYSIRFKLLNRKRIDLRSDMADEIASLKNILGQLDPPPSGSDAETAFNELASKISDELGKIGGLRQTSPPDIHSFSANTTSNVYDEKASSAVLSSLTHIRDQTARHQAIISQMKTYYAVVEKCDGLLDRTTSAISTLREALDNPASAQPVMEDVLRSALSVRREFLKISHAQP